MSPESAAVRPGAAPTPRTDSAVLYIAERMPPSVGGQENYSVHICAQLRAHVPTRVIRPGFYWKLNLHKPWFLAAALVAALREGRRRPISHVHVSSARIAPLGVLVARLLGARASASVHGLDVTLTGKSPLYGRLTPYSLRRCHSILANSHATREQALSLGLDPERCHVVPCGVDAEQARRQLPRPEARRRLGRALGLDLGRGPLLLTVGRLIRRKGVAWFVRHVMPRLAPDSAYLVLGQQGPERGPVLQAVREGRLAGRVHLRLGAPDSLRDLAYDAADLFVMPNIPVPGHREGFGIVLLEAGAHGLPVVASRIEGIPDAVRPGETGLLAEAGDSSSFAAAIAAALEWRASPDAVRAAVRRHYSWERAYDGFARFLGLPPRATESPPRPHPELQP